jgi:succinate dehydrogenase/fumarate reductase-like Fe-S protein
VGPERGLWEKLCEEWEEKINFDHTCAGEYMCPSCHMHINVIMIITKNFLKGK